VHVGVLRRQSFLRRGLRAAAKGPGGLYLDGRVTIVISGGGRARVAWKSWRELGASVRPGIGDGMKLNSEATERPQL
jgi:hypothetical protein